MNHSFQLLDYVIKGCPLFSVNQNVTSTRLANSSSPPFPFAQDINMETSNIFHSPRWGHQCSQYHTLVLNLISACLVIICDSLISASNLSNWSSNSTKSLQLLQTRMKSITAASAYSWKWRVCRFYWEVSIVPQHPVNSSTLMSAVLKPPLGKAIHIM